MYYILNYIRSFVKRKFEMRGAKGGGRREDDRRRRTDDRGRRTEDREKRIEKRGQGAELRSRRSGGGDQKGVEGCRSGLRRI